MEEKSAEAIKAGARAQVAYIDMESCQERVVRVSRWKVPAEKRTRSRDTPWRFEMRVEADAPSMERSMEGMTCTDGGREWVVPRMVV